MNLSRLREFLIFKFFGTNRANHGIAEQVRVLTISLAICGEGRPFRIYILRKMRGRATNSAIGSEIAAAL